MTLLAVMIQNEVHDHHVEMMVDMLLVLLVVRVEVVVTVDIVMEEENVLIILMKEEVHTVHNNLQNTYSCLFYREVSSLPVFYATPTPCRENQKYVSYCKTRAPFCSCNGCTLYYQIYFLRGSDFIRNTGNIYSNSCWIRLCHCWHFTHRGAWTNQVPRYQIYTPYETAYIVWESVSVVEEEIKLYSE